MMDARVTIRRSSSLFERTLPYLSVVLLKSQVESLNDLSNAKVPSDGARGSRNESLEYFATLSWSPLHLHKFREVESSLALAAFARK